MNELNWGLIDSSEKFQGLVGVLIMHMDPQARGFIAQGPDRGIDAISGNGKTIYQAKYHRIEGKAALTQIKKDTWHELDKIKRYIKSEDLWKKVNKWILVTNADISPQHLEKWKVKFEPEFKDLGIEIALWDRVVLESLLVDYPAIIEGFFKGKNRTFLTPPEYKKVLCEEQILPTAWEISLKGREKELEVLQEFLEPGQDDRILAIKGAQGTGKTRLLFEAGEIVLGTDTWEPGWLVYWANVETMQQSVTWNAELPMGKKTLLLVDEPDQQLITRLHEYLRSATNQVKAIITVPDMSVDLPKGIQKIDLVPLPKEISLDMIRVLINKEFRDSNIDIEPATYMVYSASYGFPAWAAWVIYMMKTGKTAVADMDKVFGRYFREVCHTTGRACKPELLQDLIRWIALLGKIDIEDRNTLNLLAGQLNTSSDRTQECIRDLVERRIVFKRHRYYRVEPQIFAEWILVDWLTMPVSGNKRRPTEALQRLAEWIMQIGDTAFQRWTRNIFFALSQVSGLLDRSSRRLIDPLMEFYQDKTKQIPISEVPLFLERLIPLGWIRPENFVEIINTLQTAEKPEEQSLWKELRFNHSYVVRRLAWPLFNVATQVKDPDDFLLVLGKLVDLVSDEHKHLEQEWENIKNDGKRAETLIARLITDESAGFDHAQVFFELGKQKLEDYIQRNKEITDSDAAVLTALIGSQLTLVRTRTRGPYTFKMQISRFFVRCGSSIAENRKALKQLVWEGLERNDLEPSLVAVLWDLAYTAHHAAIEARGNATEDSECWRHWRQELMEDLERVKHILKTKRIDAMERAKAYRLWEWHLWYDKDQDLHQAAEQCKDLEDENFDPDVVQLYRSNYLDEQKPEIQELLNRIADRWVKGDQEEFEKNIKAFLSEAVRFKGQEGALSPIGVIAGRVISKAPEHPGIDYFVDKHIGKVHQLTQDNAADKGYVWTALMLALVKLRYLRKRNNKMAMKDYLNRLLHHQPGPEAALVFLLWLYGRDMPQKGNQWMSIEQDIILEHIKEPIALDPGYVEGIYTVLGYLLAQDWEQTAPIVEKWLDQCPFQRPVKAVTNLIQRTQFVIRPQRGIDPDGLGRKHIEWLLDLLLIVPDLDMVLPGLDYHIKEICAVLDAKPSIVWLSRFITKAKEDAILNAIHRPSVYVEALQRGVKERPDWQETEKAIAHIIDLAFKPKLGWWLVLPKYLMDIDPSGVAVPDILIKRVDKLDQNSPDFLREITTLAHLASAWDEISSPWRKIAEKVVQVAHKSNDTTIQRKVFAALYGLLGGRAHVHSGPPDQMDPYYEQDLERARHALEKETDPYMKSYWRWRVRDAESALESARRRFEELMEDFE